MRADDKAQDPRYPQRRHLRRLERIAVSGSPIYFLTCTVQGRRPLLACAAASAALVEAWRAVEDSCGWCIGRYVVMPDHVHFFAAPACDEAKSLSTLVASWKRRATRRRRRCRPGFAWQTEFFDHLLRSTASYEQKWEYVHGNPVRKGLVERAEEWPYQGELTVIRW